jgi:hypothetical protein
MERLPGLIVGRAKGVEKSARGKGSVLEHLKAEEAQDVLRRLIASHPDLGAEAEAIARSNLAEATFGTIADEVHKAVCALDLSDLNGRAGQHEWGYVEPTEAAWEILEETVKPFVEDMKRRIELGLETDALEICKGVVLGLHRVQHDKGDGLIEWAPDFPAEAAGDAIATWLAGSGPRKAARVGPRRNRPAFPREFADRFAPEWRDMIDRVVSRRG